jgi:AbrB family looped-hinge helix DNA binding protein
MAACARISHMKYTVKISKKGSITIPVELRTALGLKPGQKVRQLIEKDKLILDFGMVAEAPAQNVMSSKK